MERGITHCKNCLKKLSSSEFEFCDRCKSEMSDKNIDKEILIEFTDGKKAKILDIKDINTEKIIQDLSKRLIDKNKELEKNKKIAEKLAEELEKCSLDDKEGLLDWARKEVEKNDN